MSSSQSCSGLQEKQFDTDRLWSDETGTNIKLVQKVREEIKSFNAILSAPAEPHPILSISKPS